ncbi:MAG: Fic family protein [Bdellovibrionaceae bacterium]|nr:Fic family protein [Pseudobdellovibrionaceae bacterium]
MEAPPYTITSQILHLVSEVQFLLGESKHLTVKKPSVKLRKENKIKTIHHSLAIEGNSLTEAQVSSLIEGKKVIGPKKQILEVKNAIQLYERVGELNPLRESDFLKAHKILMTGLLDKPGFYRSQAVGIFKDGKVSRMAPPAKQIRGLMLNLFSFVNTDKETLPLVMACIFHYELEFIHPFEDGNGRMGRLWQQLLLMKASPVFEYLSIESLIHQNQKKYYLALEKSDVKGESTDFIEFSLEMILKSLKEFSGEIISAKPKAGDRIDLAAEYFKSQSFTRKDYMNLFKEIATATASRDLAQAVASGLLKINGTKSKAVYSLSKKKK